jgi:hypothetical protein
MGLFLFVSAIKNKSPIEIAAATKSYLSHKNVIADVKSFSQWRTSRQSKGIDMHDIITLPISMTSIYSPQNRWSVVIYNDCHFEEKEISKFLSVQLQTLISLIEVYDSDIWYHYLYYNGNQVDRFCSNPEEYEKQEEWHLLKGNAKKFAFYFAVEERTIEPYLFQFSSENRINYPAKKAHVDDEYHLGNEWVFIDFWKRLGIRYPTEVPEIVIIHEK